MTWPDELFDHRDLTAGAVTAIGEAGLAAADAMVAEACAAAARDDAVFA